MHIKATGKFRWKSGMGEYIGFAIVVPILLAIILFIISIFQVSNCEQKLIYASYMAGRAAVTASSKEEALSAMREALEEIYGDSMDNVQYDIGIDAGNWVKGNVTLISVAEDIRPVFPIGYGTHQRSIGMMIEHSPWTKENVTY